MGQDLEDMRGNAVADRAAKTARESATFAEEMK